MSLIDLISNIACLLLWLNWRAQPSDTSRLAPPATLVGTLRRADKPALRGWQFPSVRVAVLILRAALYRVIGPSVAWSGSLDLGVISVSMRSDDFWRMLFFSALSFGLVLAVFQFWLLFLSLVQPRSGESLPFQPFIRGNLGFADALPSGMKLILPFVISGTIWWLLSWPFAAWGITPKPVSTAHRFEQALVIACASYLTWKYIIGVVLGLHLLHCYIFFGRHPLWSYVDAVARRVVYPLRALPLRVGRVDFAPVLMLVLVFGAASLIAGGRMIWLFGWHRVPGLQELYQRLPL